MWRRVLFRIGGFLILCAIIQCKQDAKKIYIGKMYVPVYSEKWEEIDQYIQDNWETTLVKANNLPFPFLSVSPNHRIIFYWDAYFTNAGVLYHENVAQHAKSNTDNLLYQVVKYGYVPNSSAAWGLNRSQPPYLAMMVRDVYENMPRKNTSWLRKAYRTLKTEYNFWTDDSPKAAEKNTTPIPRLLRYFHHATEKEMVTFYDDVLVRRFNYPPDVHRNQKILAANPYMAEAESGMDFTPRFEGRCPDFVAVDLNTNLYLYEKILDWIVNELGLRNEPDWDAKAEARKNLINEYCWNEHRGLFLDYDYVNERHSSVAAVTTFHPLWAGFATEEQAARVRGNLQLFEHDWGVGVCEQTEQLLAYQWDYNVGWAPMHYIVYHALKNYGYDIDAKRVAGKYLDLLAKNYASPTPDSLQKNDETIAREPGKLYEKYNVIDGTIYDGEYPSRAFLGWTAGVFVDALRFYRND